MGKSRRDPRIHPIRSRDVRIRPCSKPRKARRLQSSTSARPSLRGPWGCLDEEAGWRRPPMRHGGGAMGRSRRDLRIHLLRGRDVRIRLWSKPRAARTSLSSRGAGAWFRGALGLLARGSRLAKSTDAPWRWRDGKISSRSTHPSASRSTKPGHIFISDARPRSCRDRVVASLIREPSPLVEGIIPP